MNINLNCKNCNVRERKTFPLTIGIMHWCPKLESNINVHVLEENIHPDCPLNKNNENSNDTNH